MLGASNPIPTLSTKPNRIANPYHRLGAVIGARMRTMAGVFPQHIDPPLQELGFVLYVSFLIWRFVFGGYMLARRTLAYEGKDNVYADEKT